MVLGPVGGGSGFSHLSLGLPGGHHLLDSRLCTLSVGPLSKLESWSPRGLVIWGC